MRAGRHPRLGLELGALAAAGAAATAAVLLQRRHLGRVARDPEQEVLRTPPRGRALGVRSADGTQLYAEVFGPDDGLTFVLAHGWTEMLAYWIYVIRALTERGFRVVAYDLRGHGQSGPGSGGDYAIARFGEDLEAVLEAAVTDGRRAIVAGHSLGAMSIAAWAEHHDVGARACGAAFLNTGVSNLVTDHLIVPLPWLANALNRILGPAAFVGSRAPVPRFSTPISQAALRYGVFGPAASPAQIAFYEQMLVACPPDVRADIGIAISELELSHALARLTIPTLVLAGEKDRLTPPAHAKRIAAELPRLQRLVILEQTGHMAPLERPDAVTDALVGLARACSGAATVAA